MTRPLESSASPAPGDRDDHAGIIAKLLDWATENDNIRAIVQTGSSTRAPGDADRFSDRDIEIICRDTAPLATDDAWIHALAPVWVALYLENDPGDFETRLVFFEGPCKVDFTIADLSLIDRVMKYGHLDAHHQRGYRILLDKDGLTEGWPTSTGASPRKPVPTAKDFVDTVTEFWFEAAHMPTYLTREDLWVVKLRDGTMKEMLLRMLEWHTLLTHGPETDTWYIGTKMKRWVDPAIWEELQDIFGQFDVADSFRALEATMQLFTRLTHEVAAIARFDVPTAEQHIQAYVLGFANAFRHPDTA